MDTERIIVPTSRPEVVLKQFIPEDAVLLFELIDRNRAHLSQRGDETGKKYPSLVSVERSITHPPQPSRFRFGIWSDAPLTGSINLTPMTNAATYRDDLAEIGYWTGGEFCRQGFATLATTTLAEYALYTMGFIAVLARVHKKNRVSQRVLEYAGFYLEKIDDTLFYFAREE